MDAIMAVLAATLLANADGRYGRLLSLLLDVRGDRRATVFAFFGSFFLLAVVSATGAVLAGQMLGLGALNLFAAIALASAAAALLWSQRGAVDAEGLTAAPLPLLAIRLTMVQLGDRNQFLIFALGALSGSALWGIAGGVAGLLVAMLPLLGWGSAIADRRGATWLRWAAAAVLLIWAVSHARRAFGV
jgi:Ca2+/H+ antiporter, TMEM165/GDT1 family